MTQNLMVKLMGENWQKGAECHASLCICVSVGVPGRWMKVKGTCGIL